MSDSRPEVNLCDADPLARSLARLRPAGPGVDLPTLMYQAGRASRDRTVTLWRRATLLVGLLLVGTWATGYVVWQRLRALDELAPAAPQPPASPQPEIAPFPRDAVIPPSGPTAVEEVAGGPDPTALRDYLTVRQRVLTVGLAGLPNSAPSAPGVQSPLDLERSLHLPPGVLAVPYFFPDRKPAP